MEPAVEGYHGVGPTEELGIDLAGAAKNRSSGAMNIGSSSDLRTAQA